MYEIDFLPVESESGLGSKSGDAIALRFTAEQEQRNVVVVIDGGFSHVGEKLAEHVKQYFSTTEIDLVISTHPDADHLNGLTTLLENAEFTVRELLIHQPRAHFSNVADFSNLESLDKLLSTAKNNGVTLTEPFTGLTRFGGQLKILGPSLSYYEELIQQHLEEERSGFSRGQAKTRVSEMAKTMLSKLLTFLPIETLTDEGDTGPRNNSSVITLIQSSQQKLLFTGDAGVPALEAACTEYENTVGMFSDEPLSFLQVPHHGSRRNVGPTLMNRMIGSAGAPFRNGMPAFISSAKISEKHPSPKVVNALTRRGSEVFATEGRTIHQSHGALARPGWTSLTPFSPLVEDDDE